MSWWMDRDTAADGEEEARLTATLVPWSRERIKLLSQIAMVSEDQALAEALARLPDGELNARRRHWIRQLLWRYRRRLAPEIRPKLNPDDPIVRAMEEAGV